MCLSLPGLLWWPLHLAKNGVLSFWDGLLSKSLSLWFWSLCISCPLFIWSQVRLLELLVCLFHQVGDLWLTCSRVGPAGWDCIDPIWRRLVFGVPWWCFGGGHIPCFCLGGSLIKRIPGKSKGYWFNPIFWWKRLIFFFPKRNWVYLGETRVRGLFSP